MDTRNIPTPHQVAYTIVNGISLTAKDKKTKADI
jgi:hypothetical protein